MVALSALLGNQHTTQSSPERAHKLSVREVGQQFLAIQSQASNFALADDLAEVLQTSSGMKVNSLIDLDHELLDSQQPDDDKPEEIPTKAPSGNLYSAKQRSNQTYF